MDGIGDVGTPRVGNDAPRVTLRPNVAKTLAAIACLIAKAGKEKRQLTQYDILKMLFLADKAHFNIYGRPITFDNYFAMKEGPVPSLAYDLLKQSQATMKRMHLRKLPWRRTKNPETGTGRYFYFDADYSELEASLSESDQESLANSFIAISSLTFSQVKRLLHADPAYLEAWQPDGPKKAFKMSFGMLLDSPDHEQAQAVEFMSKHS
ncbi:Panacea domain-containing protein [Rhodopila sp.]|uniref:Panacea domain-containing protein n=1 Tax=Rhodopila sp. TaxID=2480087 RepID=UPI003D095E23